MTYLSADDHEQILSAALANDEQGLFPRDSFSLLVDRGLIARPTDADYGIDEALAFIEELGQADPALALFVAFQISYVQDFKTGVWPSSLSGALLDGIRHRGESVSLLATEPELGQVTLGGYPKTAIRREHGELRLYGEKIYATGFEQLDWLIVSSTFEYAGAGYGNVLLRKEAIEPFVELHREWDAFGMRSTRSDRVVFNGVPVDPDAIINVVSSDGTRTLQHAGQRSAWQTILIAALYQGQARAALHWFVDFAGRRTPTNLGRSLLTLPAFEEAVGTAVELLYANDAVLRQGAQALADDPAGRETWWKTHLGRITVQRNVETVLQLLVQKVGNRGLTRTSPFTFFYRNALHGRLHGPSAELLHAAATRDLVE